jgi:hypothetical protein
MISASSVILSCCQTWEILKNIFIKLFMVLLSSMGLSESLITSYKHSSLFHLTGFDGICGVSVDEVECHLLGPNLLQDQKLDPQVHNHVYDWSG